MYDSRLPISDEVRRRGFVAMRPSLSTGFSLINFIIELKDFKSFFHGKPKVDVRGMTKAQAQSAQAAAKASHRIKAQIRKEKFEKQTIPHFVADKYLEAEFAWLPLVSDLKKIWEILTSLQKRVSRFLDSAKEASLRRHYRRSIDTSHVDLVAITGEWGPNTAWAWNEFVEDGPPTWELRPRFVSQFSAGSGLSKDDSYEITLTMEFTYTVHKLVELNSWLLATMQSFGVRPDASIVWNALPYTFIIDWFWNVSDYLDKNWSVDVIDAVVVVADWIESCKGTIVYDLFIPHRVYNYSAFPGYRLYIPEQYIPRVATAFYYHRQSYSVTDDQAQTLRPGDGLTLDRAYISSALAVTRQRNRHRGSKVKK
jgi:hypothetical protein